jgi:hypothetical protein
MAASTTTSGNFFYNNYGVKHFMTLNRPIPIETAKNIVIVWACEDCYLGFKNFKLCQACF